jgi:Immunity protein Imm1
MWSDADGLTHHSVGDPDAENCLVADYLGSYTEIPEVFAVDLDLAHAAATAYLESGHPTTPGLTLEPD